MNGTTASRVRAAAVNELGKQNADSTDTETRGSFGSICSAVRGSVRGSGSVSTVYTMQPLQPLHYSEHSPQTARKTFRKKMLVDAPVFIVPRKKQDITKPEVKQRRAQSAISPTKGKGSISSGFFSDYSNDYSNDYPTSSAGSPSQRRFSFGGSVVDSTVTEMTGLLTDRVYSGRNNNESDLLDPFPKLSLSDSMDFDDSTSLSSGFFQPSQSKSTISKSLGSSGSIGNYSYSDYQSSNRDLKRETGIAPSTASVPAALAPKKSVSSPKYSSSKLAVRPGRGRQGGDKFLVSKSANLSPLLVRANNMSGKSGDKSAPVLNKMSLSTPILPLSFTMDLNDENQKNASPTKQLKT